MAVYKQHQIGEEGERQAKEYLEQNGLKLVEQNYHCYHGEVDLIMQDKMTLVFVEVRQRQDNRLGSAIESIHGGKQKKLIKTATHFLQRKKWLNRVNCRFDVIALHPHRGEIKLEWIKNAFST